jgi:NTE family protein
VPFDIDRFQTDLAVLSGLDRYETIAWRIVSNATGETGLLVEGRPKPYGPPFLMLGFNLENTTSEDFRMTLTARYLRYDLIGSGSEVRIDGTLGSDPGLALSLYKPLGKTPLFVSPYAGVVSRTLNLIQDDAIVASYGEVLSRAGLDVGANLGRNSDLRVGGYVGRLKANVQVGDPGLPSAHGKETVAEAKWRYDSQDSPVVPSRGSRVLSNLSHVFDGPDITPPLESGRSSVDLTQLTGEANTFWSLGDRGRLFVLGGGGTSFGSRPLPTDQFAIGSPFHLGALDFGEVRGDHYYVGTAGYFHQLGRLPDFMGGPIFLGSWLETGNAFDSDGKKTPRVNASTGLILDTLLGPVLLGGSAGFDGRWRTYVGIGRVFGRRQD